MSLTFGTVIVGDEILSGRRADKHLAFISQALAQRGLGLRWARYIGDSLAEQAALYRDTLASDAVVFSFGGIGATPDDHTRQAAAEAAGRTLLQHPEATRLIENRFGDTAWPHRVRMAQLPEGARLIPNPVNQIAGFSIARHHFVPGFPEMAWPMVEWVLDQEYTGQGQTRLSAGFIVPDAKEGDLIALMESYVARYPALAFSSLPSFGNARYAAPHIEFSFSGEPDAAVAAAESLREALQGLGYRPQD